MSSTRLPASRLWDRVYAAQVDRLSIDKHGIPGHELMERAGSSAARHIRSLAPAGARFLILAGPGNNGGDALVVARLLTQLRLPVDVVLVHPDPQKITPDCRRQLEALNRLSVHPQSWTPGCLPSGGEEEALVVVDGILGIGLKGDLRPGPFLDCLRETAGLKTAMVIAIDVPSGADANRWDQQLPLTADVSITFGGPKPVHAVSPGRTQCGQILTEDIGFAAPAITEASRTCPPLLLRVDEEALLAGSPWDDLPADIHKYDRGHVLVIGGSAGKCGAPLMTAMAALRSGAGWATVALPPDLEKPELPVELTYEDLFTRAKPDPAAIGEFIRNRRVRSLVIGPGTTTSLLDAALMKELCRLMADTGLFVVIDAGCLQGLPDLLKKSAATPGRLLLTPHPGEWRTMVGKAAPAPTNQELVATIQKTWQPSGATILYKSATPLLLAPGATPVVLNGGSNALAKAGTGDVLCGAVAAHGALGSDATYAGARGLALLNRAAAICAEDFGPHGLLPTDLITGLAKASSPAPTSRKPK